MGGRIIHGREWGARALAILATLAIPGSGSGCAHAPASVGTAPAAEQCGAGAFEREAVIAVLETQREGWNAGDLDAFLAGYEPSEALLFTSGSKIRRGFAETRDKYRARYGEARETMGVLAFEILDVRPLGRCSDAAIVLGRWAVSESPESGSGVFSVILERQGEGPGVWRIVHDHTSADPPPS